MARKAITQKVRSKLQKEINSICPFCHNEDVEHFQVHHIDNNHENNEISNLLLLCPLCHSKITKGDITDDEVRRIKIGLNSSNVVRLRPQGNQQVTNFNAPIQNAVVGNNNTVTIKQTKPRLSKKRSYPEGCIGADNSKANYVSYLIDRYHEYKEYDVGKRQMNYAIFPSNLKKKFKIGKTRTIYHVPVERFEELTLYIQTRIDKTILAKVNKGKGMLHYYVLLDEYLAQTMGEDSHDES